MTRYDNKTTKICKIIFSVICFLFSAFLIALMIESGIEIHAGKGFAVIGLLLITIVTAIGVGLLVIPFILILILCRKPWLPLAAYVLLVLLEGACFIMIAIA